MINREDIEFMKLALEEAYIAYDLEEVPIGAVIVKNGKVIGKGHNTVENSNHSFEHAEINAIKTASDYIDGWRLDGATMYVTKEPCAMCAGALVLSRIKRVVIGVRDEKRGFAGSVLNLVNDDVFNHKLEVQFGVLEEECLNLIQDFFKKKRKK